jgi:hypothetical protein
MSFNGLEHLNWCRLNSSYLSVREKTKTVRQKFDQKLMFLNKSYRFEISFDREFQRKVNKMNPNQKRRFFLMLYNEQIQ